jgi:transposase-like protein
MKYTKETTEQIVQQYRDGTSVEEIATTLDVPSRSVIAKLSSLGVYQKKSYLNKRGEVPVKKEVYIEQVAELLEVEVDRLESLEKCNKSVLQLIIKALQAVADQKKISTIRKASVNFFNFPKLSPTDPKTGRLRGN